MMTNNCKQNARSPRHVLNGYKRKSDITRHDLILIYSQFQIDNKIFKYYFNKLVIDIIFVS